jgi:hypothetical protein
MKKIKKFYRRLDVGGKRSARLSGKEKALKQRVDAAHARLNRSEGILDPSYGELGRAMRDYEPARSILKKHEKIKAATRAKAKKYAKTAGYTAGAGAGAGLATAGLVRHRRRKQEMSALDDLFEFREQRSPEARRYIDYHTRKSLNTYRKDQRSALLKGAGVGAAAGAVAGGLAGGVRMKKVPGGRVGAVHYKKGKMGAIGGALAAGYGGMLWQNRSKAKRTRVENIKARAAREHMVRVRADRLRRNPKVRAVRIHPEHNQREYRK